MKCLVFTGKHFEFRPEEKSEPVSQLGDMPKRPQAASSNARVYRAVLGPLRTTGNGYRPGPVLDMAADQCRFTVHGTTMCGAKIAGESSYCEVHRAVCYPAYRRFLESAD